MTFVAFRPHTSDTREDQCRRDTDIAVPAVVVDGGFRWQNDWSFMVATVRTVVTRSGWAMDGAEAERRSSLKTKPD